MWGKPIVCRNMRFDCCGKRSTVKTNVSTVTSSLQRCISSTVGVALAGFRKSIFLRFGNLEKTTLCDENINDLGAFIQELTGYSEVKDIKLGKNS